MAELMDRVGSDNLICLYDTANAAKEAWNYYEAVKDRIKYIHVKDTVGKQRFTYPDEGISEVSRVLEDQYKLGYRGVVSIEPHMSKSAHKPNLEGDAETSNRIYLEYGGRLNRIVEKIASQE
jgi:sugar phosphate isomerase/epimerase